MSDNYTNTNTRGDTLNQEAAHDTGLYDPNIHDNHIVAMYEDVAHAWAARDTLSANGVPEHAIRVSDADQDRFAGGVDYERNDGGLWGAIRSLFMPDEDAHGYAEGVRRGHAILVVQPDATMDRHRLIALLESTNPVDFDAKLEEWRQAGYSYPSTTAAGATGAAMNAPATTGVAADTGAMRATDTTAAGTFRNAPSRSTVENEPLSGTRADDLPGRDDKSRDETARSTVADGAASPVTAARPPAGPDGTAKVIEERPRSGKREAVTGAVRVRSYVVERPAEQ